MELHQVEDDAVKSIKSKFSKVGESTTQPFIYKVHGKFLHNSEDKVYEPEVVAIGPYHRGKQHLEMVEQIKHSYLSSFLVHKHDSVERYISAVAEIEQAARSCYAEPISLTPAAFVEMLVLDACFIILFMFRLFMENLGDPDPFFQMKWVCASLSRDLVLFENQIPFFVLCKMFDLIYGPNQHQRLIRLLCCLLGKGDLHSSSWNNRSPEDVKHLLHLIHTVSRPSSFNHLPNSNDPSHPREDQVIPCASELKDANIRFLKIDSTNEYEVEFKDGTLKMPALTIHDGMERSLRNLVLYEQYFPDNQPTYVTDYRYFLDCLVNTSKDVEILSQCGIIQNITADNQEAADIINRGGRSVVISLEPDFIYSDVFASINAHYKKPWNRAWAALHRDYFNSPWAYFSVGAAVVLLLLTVAQTVLSALQL